MSTIGNVAKRLALGVAVIAACSAVLLFSDLSSRRPQPREAVARIAFFKYFSTPVLDEIERGVFQALAARGFSGGRLQADLFSADADMTTANLIAKRIVEGRYTLAITVSTVAMQALARANERGEVRHVFGAVTDPVGAGVGIKSLGTLDKPGHLTGAGTFQPVAETLRLARRMNPALRTIGVVWTPAEANSEACVKKARVVSKEMGVALLEAAVERTSDVQNAAEALVERGAEAIWCGCDNLVAVNISEVAAAAAKAGIPAFSQRAGDVRSGTLFDLGPDYLEIGRIIGGISADILDGGSPETMPVTNIVPERLMLNEKVRAALRDRWTFPDDALAKAELRIQVDGREVQAATKESGMPRFGRLWNLHLVTYSESVPAEEAMRGFVEALGTSGLRAGLDYTLTTHSAQGDMASLPSIMDAVLTARADALIVLSTPTLQAAMQKVRTIPIVFTVVADPFLLKAATSDTDHLPNVTGVYTVGAYREMSELLAAHFPRYRRVGTLFTPAETNSVANKDRFVAEAKKRGIQVDTVPVQTSTELPDAAMALASRPIDAIVQVLDNLTMAGFSPLSRAAFGRKLPVVGFFSSAIAQGAALTLSRDYVDAGRETEEKLLRVMAGESPARIPLSPPRTTVLTVSEANAAKQGMTIPPALLKMAVKK